MTSVLQYPQYPQYGTAMALTEDGRFLIKRAREVAPSLRDGGIREQLAAQLLTQLADLAERLGDDPECE